MELKIVYVFLCALALNAESVLFKDGNYMDESICKEMTQTFLVEKYEFTDKHVLNEIATIVCKLIAHSMTGSDSIELEKIIAADFEAIKDNWLLDPVNSKTIGKYIDEANDQDLLEGMHFLTIMLDDIDSKLPRSMDLGFVNAKNAIVFVFLSNYYENELQDAFTYMFEMVGSMIEVEEEDLHVPPEEVGEQLLMHLEPYGLGAEDVPRQVANFLSRYWNILVDADQQFKMIKMIKADYKLIISLIIDVEANNKILRSYVDEAIKLNLLDDELVLDRLCTELVNKLPVKIPTLEFVPFHDAIKYLIFRHAYPNVMQAAKSYGIDIHSTILQTVQDTKGSMDIEPEAVAKILEPFLLTPVTSEEIPSPLKNILVRFWNNFFAFKDEDDVNFFHLVYLLKQDYAVISKYGVPECDESSTFLDLLNIAKTITEEDMDDYIAAIVPKLQFIYDLGYVSPSEALKYIIYSKLCPHIFVGVNAVVENIYTDFKDGYTEYLETKATDQLDGMLKKLDISKSDMDSEYAKWIVRLSARISSEKYFASEATLDDLDALSEFLTMQAFYLRTFVTSYSYEEVTDKWINSTVSEAIKIFKIMPLQEWLRLYHTNSEYPMDKIAYILLQYGKYETSMEEWKPVESFEEMVVYLYTEMSHHFRKMNFNLEEWLSYKFGIEVGDEDMAQVILRAIFKKLEMEDISRNLLSDTFLEIIEATAGRMNAVLLDYSINMEEVETDAETFKNFLTNLRDAISTILTGFDFEQDMIKYMVDKLAAPFLKFASKEEIVKLYNICIKNSQSQNAILKLAYITFEDVNMIKASGRPFKKATDIDVRNIQMYFVGLGTAGNSYPIVKAFRMLSQEWVSSN